NEVMYNSVSSPRAFRGLALGRKPQSCMYGDGFTLLLSLFDGRTRGFLHHEAAPAANGIYIWVIAVVRPGWDSNRRQRDKHEYEQDELVGPGRCVGAYSRLGFPFRAGRYPSNGTAASAAPQGTAVPTAEAAGKASLPPRWPHGCLAGPMAEETA